MTPVERLEPFDSDTFLSHYWQQRPCLIGNWLRPKALDLESLLDLADEHELPSRLVTGNQSSENWTLTHGPLDDLPMVEHDWTLLVQEVDKVSPEVAAILGHFRFLPDWMIDDVMISQAVDGGSVGAHVDAYDVFLVQAAGRRRWQLAGEFDPQIDERFEMALLRNWQPEEELVVEPGDALYLPAGIAHHGVAEDRCQTWSVGLRTPSGPELLFYLAETLAEQSDQHPRLGVPDPDPDNPSLIHAKTLTRIRQLLTNCLQLDDRQLADLSARFLTTWRAWPEDGASCSLEQLVKTLQAGQPVSLASSARLALIEQDGETIVVVNGETIDCPSELALELARTRTLTPPWVDHLQTIKQLIEADALLERFPE